MTNLRGRDVFVAVVLGIAVGALLAVLGVDDSIGVPACQGIQLAVMALALFVLVRRECRRSVTVYVSADWDTSPGEQRARARRSVRSAKSEADK